jgi:hypothetical protein
LSFSHAGDYEDYHCLLGCDATQPGKSFPKFQNNLLPPPSEFKKLEATDLSETLATIYQISQRHCLKEGILK